MNAETPDPITSGLGTSDVTFRLASHNQCLEKDEVKTLEHVKWAESHARNFQWVLVNGSPIEEIIEDTGLTRNSQLIPS